MRRMWMVLPGMALFAALLVGCGSAGGETTAPGSSDTAAPVVQATATEEPVAPFDITLAQDATKLIMTVGQTTTVKLGYFYYWTVTVSDPTVVGLKEGMELQQGEQGVYEALKVGKVTLSAVGNSCETPPCAMPAQEFTVDIEVK